MIGSILQVLVKLTLIRFAISNDDLGLISIDEPESGNLSDSEPIVVTIQNLGNNSASNFNVSYQINDGDVISETYSATLASGTSLQYTFNQTADMSDAGDYQIVATITYSVDEVDTNNSVTKNITNVASGDCPDEYSLPTVWRQL